MPPDTPSRTASFVPKALQPTDEQFAIQTAPDRTIVVEANAGAAKTTTLALRMAESWRRGTQPEQVLALTYTPPACEALGGALARIGVPHEVVRRFRIQTFEAFCEEVLQEIGGGPVPLYEHDEQLRPHVWAAIRRVEADERDRWGSELILPALGDNGAVEDVLRVAIRLKGTMRDVLERGDSSVSPDYAASIGVDYTQLRIFLAYERIRRRENAERPLFRGPLDATYDLARLLLEGEALQDLRSWPRGVRVLVVDEMHDLNEAMFRVLQELLDTTAAFFCGVGDFDQVLHAAAGADAGFMGRAIEERTRRTVRRYPLTHSYRFGRSLAVEAGRIAGKPYGSRAAHDTVLALQSYDTPAQCAVSVAEAACAWQRRPKAKMSELSILLRHPYQSVLVENALLERGLPYTVRGFDSYLVRPEVLFVRGVLAVATDDIASVADDRVREQVMQALMFFSGSRIQVRGREEESQEALLLDALRSVKEAPGFLTHFFENQILRTAEPAMQRRLKAAVRVAREQAGPTVLACLLEALEIERLVRDVYVSARRRREALGNLEALQLAAMNFGSAADYFRSLNAAEQKQRQLKKTASLVIAGIPDVKGLEFDHVLLPFLAQGEFPSSGSDREERNLFYVAMTRARRFLTMWASAARPSEFVERMGRPVAGAGPG
jgi:DNA helicase II / ATP-dependent DNA helicase PcrA